MQIQREKISEYQRYYKRSGEPVCLVTKFLVDETCIECSNVILTEHSAEFYDKEELYLHEFNGEIDKVYDILELLHGYEVQIDINNIEAIAKFGLIYKCKELVSIAETWLEDEFGKAIEKDMILSIARILLKMFKLGHTGIIQNVKVKEGFSLNAEVIAKELTKSGVNDGLFFLHFILGPEISQINILPPLSDSVDTEYKYKVALNLINELIDMDPGLVCIRTEQVDNLIEKGMDLVSSRENIRLHCKIARDIEKLKRDYMLSGGVLNDVTPIVESGSWKSYGWKEIISLKETTDITQFQYFDVVINWFQINPHVDDETKYALVSSTDQYLFKDMQSVIHGCFGSLNVGANNVSEDPHCKHLMLYDNGHRGIFFHDFDLILQDGRQAVFKKIKSVPVTPVIQIKNINNRAQIVYVSSDVKALRNVVHWFTYMYDPAHQSYTHFGSLVTNTYTEFVSNIVKNKGQIRLCGLYKNRNYNGKKKFLV